MFILVIAGDGRHQKGWMKEFPNTKKLAWVSPGNESVYVLDHPTAFDYDQAANTHTTENFKFPFPVEITALNARASEAFAWTTLNADVAIGLAASDVTTVSLAISAVRHTTTKPVGDVSTGAYQSTLCGSNVCAADTLYEIGIIVRPTGGIVTGQVDHHDIWFRPIPNTEN